MKNEKGITLIALIITIIVMLILVAVTVNVAINGRLFGEANKATTGTEEKAIYDQIISAMVLKDKGILNVSETAKVAIGDLKSKGYTVSPDINGVDVNATQVTLTVTGKKGTYKYTITGEEIKIAEEKIVDPNIPEEGDIIYLNEEIQIVDENGNIDENQNQEIGWILVKKPETNKDGTIGYYSFLIYFGSASNLVIDPSNLHEAIYDVDNGIVKVNKKITSADISGAEINPFIYSHKNLESLKTVNFDNLEIKLGAGTFYGAINLENVLGLDNVKAIHDNTFYNCTSLKTIELKNVCYINCNAFSNSGLEVITLPGNLSDNRSEGKSSGMQQDAFENCSNLRKVIVNGPKAECDYVDSLESAVTYAGKSTAIIEYKEQ